MLGARSPWQEGHAYVVLERIPKTLVNVAPDGLEPLLADPLELPLAPLADPLELPLAAPLDATDASDPASSGAPDEPTPELPLEAPDDPTGLLVTAPELLPELLSLPTEAASSEADSASPLFAALDAASAVTGFNVPWSSGVRPPPELPLQPASASQATAIPIGWTPSPQVRIRLIPTS
jgi:hypothetical protein